MKITLVKKSGSRFIEFAIGQSASGLCASAKHRGRNFNQLSQAHKAYCSFLVVNGPEVSVALSAKRLLMNEVTLTPAPAFEPTNVL